ncbi:50S ribosomal protein L13 [Candidatus Uhrbacteria bacterium]|nr:50S ribosomal protein L13 [Candidatus Uhrbacteria bacterium]
MATKNITTVRKTVTIDATGKVLGRLATSIAMNLMGKTSAAYVPNVDAGNAVVVTNVAGMKVTGKKYEQKEYFRHSGWPGGIHKKTMREMWEKDPAEVLRAAVSRMLPKNKHRTNRLKRLTIS